MVKKIAIVSLSSGILGEDFIQFEKEIGLKRLNDYGIEVVMMPHTLSGIDYVKNHPEDRASDLIQALNDNSIDMILCSIGGDDTYKLLPYLFGNDELKKAVDIASAGKPGKIFLGFSDTTFNHLMLNKVGFKTFYGQAFLPDVCELDKEILPYTKHYFEELIKTGRISEIKPSPVWYDERTDWSEKAVGIPKPSHDNQGFQLLQGSAVFEGEILGGCIDSLFDIFDNDRYEDSVDLCEKYELFPKKEEWAGKILLLESSEEKPVPDHYRKMLEVLKNTGIFDVVSGIICGKPMDEIYFEEYKKIIVEVVDNKDLPIVANINVGHSIPRCIIPFGVKATVDADEQVISFAYQTK